MGDYSEERMKEEWEREWYNSESNDDAGYLYKISSEGRDLGDAIFKRFRSLFRSYRAAVREEIEKLEPPYDTLEKDIDYDRGYQKAKEEILSSPLLAEDK